MAKVISIFNNKGGVGKSTISWNLGDALGRLGKKVLVVDFDPQCNLSIAMLGDEIFLKALPDQNQPYGTTIRAYLQRFLQNTGNEQVFLHYGPHTSSNVALLAGDFWLNIFADSLNVGADLLTGTGLSRYVALRKIVSEAEKKAAHAFDFVIVDLPPSFGALVRSAFYSSDYYIVPCTSDNFSVYCVALIGQMVPAFVSDWQIGMQRFKDSNPHFQDFDNLGRPVFGGWIFNGFDTKSKARTSSEVEGGAPMKPRVMIQADETMHNRLEGAIQTDLVARLNKQIHGYSPVGTFQASNYLIGDIEDANVLIQNSQLLNVPLGQLNKHKQVESLQDRRQWAHNQIAQIGLIREKFKETAERVVKICI